MLRRHFIATASIGALVLAAPSFAVAATGGATAGDAGLTALLDATFAEMVRFEPESATDYGLDVGTLAVLRTRLNPRGAAAEAASLARNRRSAAKLARFDTASLSQRGKLQLAVAQDIIAQRIAPPGRFGIAEAQRPYVLTHQQGAYFEIPDFLNSTHPIKTAPDCEAYLLRLAAFAAALDQDTAEQARQARRGYLAPGWSLDLVLGQLGALRGQQAEGSSIVQSLVRRAHDAGLAGDWQARAAAIVNARVYPALDRQIALVRRLRPTAKAGDGASQRLPNGAAIYALALAQATTTTLTPTQVHARGLAEVADITAQLDTILSAAGMKDGTVGERLTALNHRPEQLYPDTDAGRAALIASLNRGVDAMMGKLPQAFSRQPAHPLSIRRVPVEIQDGASNGYYSSAALDGSRPAIYWINLKSVGNWPRYSLPALTYHEGVPGHHLQINYAQSAGELPLLLRTHFYSGYGEGWALYAEQLADELGGFNGLERAGYLQSFLFRAARLVVDTGIHAMGWSRERATDYMVAATGFARARCQSEVERYCVLIGQACSYKIGHRAWVDAREKAQAALGPRFDLKWFHDVLSDGVMPLTMLAERIEARTRERLMIMAG